MPDERILKFLEEVRHKPTVEIRNKPTAADSVKMIQDRAKLNYLLGRNLSRTDSLALKLKPSKPEPKPTVKDSVTALRNYIALQKLKAELKKNEGLQLTARDSSYLDLKPPKKPTATEKDQRYAKILEQRIKAKQLAGEDAGEDLNRLKNLSDKAYRRLAEDEAKGLVKSMLESNPELDNAFIYMKVGDAIKNKYGEETARALGYLKPVFNQMGTTTQQTQPEPAIPERTEKRPAAKEPVRPELPIEEPGFTPDYAAAEGDIPYKAPTSHLQTPDFSRPPRQLSPTERAALNKTGADSSGEIPYRKLYNMRGKQEDYENDRREELDWQYRELRDKTGTNEELYKEIESRPKLKQHILSDIGYYTEYIDGKLDSLPENERRYFDKYDKYFTLKKYYDFAFNYPNDPEGRMKWIHKNLILPEYKAYKKKAEKLKKKVSSNPRESRSDELYYKTDLKNLNDYKTALHNMEFYLKKYGVL